MCFDFCRIVFDLTDMNKDTFQHNPLLAIAVIAVALAGLATPTAQAQENPANNVVQVNPYADFYSEDDCLDVRNEASSL